MHFSFIIRKLPPIFFLSFNIFLSYRFCYAFKYAIPCFRIIDMFLSENLGREFIKRRIKSMYIINIKCMYYKTLQFNFN